MGFNIRMAVIFAATAALVAVVSGFVGRVPFGYILVRSFFGSAVFGAAGFGSAVLIERFLPELLEQDDEDGSSFDISVGSDEEDDEIRRTAYSPQGVNPGGQPDEGNENSSGDSENTGLKGEFSPGIDADIIEEVQEQRLDEDALTKSPTDGLDAGNDSSDEDENGVMDALPDMEGMTDAFITAESPIEDSIEGGGSGIDNSDAQQAKEIAQAIRTVLHRDDQG